MADITGWAAARNVECLAGHALDTNSANFRENPAIDFGRFMKRIPACVLRPRDEEQLILCVRHLREQRLPYTVRGTAHSSGGQVLIADGVVLDLRYLSSIVKDDPATEEVTLQGGLWWIDLWNSLRAQGRRPAAMTDNIRTTVAGTLAVGGFADTSHIYGPQVATVRRLTLVTPDGELHDVGPSDALFRFSLAGRGQLGIIVRATIQTIRRPDILTARIHRWSTLSQFANDMMALNCNHIYEYIRTRYYWHLPENKLPLVTVAGNFSVALPAHDPVVDFLTPAKTTKWEQLNLHQHMQNDPYDKWNFCSPAMEVLLPLPDGLKHAQWIRDRIVQSGLYRYLPRGSSIMLLKSDLARFPLAPFPESEYCLLLAIRPQMPEENVEQFLPLLQQIGSSVLDSGGKIYLMSIQVPHSDFLRRQFGSALRQFLEWKRKLDPDNLLNSGLLEVRQASD